MEDNKGQTIFLSVIGIATLLVAIIGATFAYFTTTMTGDAADVNATTAKIGSVSFTAEGVTEDNTAILPGWTSGAKTVTVTYGASDIAVDYECKLNVTNVGTLTDMTVITAGDDAQISVATPVTATAMTLASGTLDTTGGTKTFTYTLSFPETGANQNTQQGQELTATVSCALSGGTLYYNTDNPTGTETEPTV